MTMPNVILIIISCLFGLILVLSIIYSVFVLKERRKCILSLATVICSLLVICCWMKNISQFLIEFIIGYFIYFICAFLLKYIASLFVAKGFSVQYDREVKFEKLCYLFFLNPFLFIVSPDYGITYLFKNVIWYTEDDERKRQIQTFNSINFVATVLYVIILCCLIFLKIDGCVMQCMIVILNIRIVSRTIEVIVSFVKDVCSKDKSSSLNWKDRILLAFISIVEVVTLAFGTGFCSGVKSGYDLSKAVYQALLILNSLGDSDSFNNASNIAKLFCGLACFSLIGIVISSYLGDKDA